MNHPLTPPPELVQEWVTELASKGMVAIVTQAANWGADRQLEMCEEWLEDHVPNSIVDMLHSAMRPEPSNLAEQALELVAKIQACKKTWQLDDVVRAALERLQELEQRND